MPVNSYWDNAEKTIQVYDFTTTWTWDEFYSAKQDADKQIDEVAHPVAVIFSGPPEVRIPEGFISQVVNVNRTRHKLAYLAIVVTPNMLVRTLMNTAGRLYAREFRQVAFAKDLGDARRIARENPPPRG